MSCFFLKIFWNEEKKDNVRYITKKSPYSMIEIVQKWYQKPRLIMPLFISQALSRRNKLFVQVSRTTASSNDMSRRNVPCYWLERWMASTAVFMSKFR